jgi:eukaryotic-like serine/threonine-protein kinase
MNEESLFAAAAALPTAAERRAFLARACGGDVALTGRVARLLAADEKGRGILDRGPGPAGPGRVESDDPPGPLAAGRVFADRFVLRHKLGAGGMGEVWVADQTEPVQRRVALKVIRQGLDPARLLARFDRERQALARMDHPNIARVLDAGVSAGVPYFAMELVEGVPVTAFCDRHRLTPRQRLELFIPICQAIQHAHQKGVIHRDVKPSNVLVAEYDGRPVPKVIDFGIAKATGDELAGHAASVEVGMLVGTLEYMSPEQAEVNNPDIDTRCDVHALGVVLYELLTGNVPVSRDQLRAAPIDEMLRIIKEVEPPRPSAKLAAAAGLPATAAARGTEPKRLVGQVKGELDWIVMKAIDKDRARRYETASALAADVQRYLADEPVLAAAPSAGYRLRKFARRHRTGLVVSAAFLTGLVVAVVALSVALVAVSRERRDKEAALQTEAKRRQLARAALDAMMSKVVERWLARQPALGDDYRAFLERLLQYCEEFASDSGRDEESRADVARAYDWVGQVRSLLGQGGEAEAAFARSRDLYAALTAEFPDATAYKVGLGWAYLRLATIARQAGRNQAARPILEVSVAGLRELAAASSDPLVRDRLARSLIELGIVLKNLDQTGPAVAAYREAIVIASGLAEEFPADPDHRCQLGWAHGNLGIVLERLDRREEARAAYARAVEVLERVVAESPGDAYSRNFLAMQGDHFAALLRDARQDREAEDRLLKALALRRQLVADFPEFPEYQSGLAVTLNNLGILYRKTDRPEKAEAAYAEAVDIHRRMADRQPGVADYQNYAAGGLVNVARLRLERRDFAGARRLLDEALPYHQAALKRAPNHPAYRNFYRLNRWRMSEALLGLNDHTGAAEAAGQFLEVNYEPPRDAYTAAGLLAGCVRLAAGDKSPPAFLRRALVAAYSDRAMEALRLAIDRKAKEVAQMKGDPKLDPLSTRPDFQPLLKKVEASRPSPVK